MASWWRTAGAALLCPVPALAIIHQWPIGVMICLVSVLMACFAVGWVRLANIPSPASALVVLLVAGAAYVLATTHVHDAGSWPLAAILALCVPVAFVREIARGGARDGLVESISAMTTGLVLLVGLSMWLPVALSQPDAWVVPTCVGAGAVGVLVLRAWRRVDSGFSLSDLARLTLPVATIGPIAWVLALAFH
ncbi:MAG: hypothetical protein LBH48_07905 [Bifidobacteriaceae bacterium]|jgi:hypothetical protein|nr:hypothetical protein [Bifidobacteriaceae bacterium]